MSIICTEYFKEQIEATQVATPGIETMMLFYMIEGETKVNEEGLETLNCRIEKCIWQKGHDVKLSNVEFLRKDVGFPRFKEVIDAIV